MVTGPAATLLYLAKRVESGTGTLIDKFCMPHAHVRSVTYTCILLVYCIVTLFFMAMLPQTAAAGARQVQWLTRPPSSVCRLCGKPDSRRSSSWQQQLQPARHRSRGASVTVRAASLLDTIRQGLGLGLGLGLGPAAFRVDISTYNGGQIVPVAAEVSSSIVAALAAGF